MIQVTVKTSRDGSSGVPNVNTENSPFVKYPEALSPYPIQKLVTLLECVILLRESPFGHVKKPLEETVPHFYHRIRRRRDNELNGLGLKLLHIFGRMIEY
jgi:hypothetical protein